MGNCLHQKKGKKGKKGRKDRRRERERKKKEKRERKEGRKEKEREKKKILGHFKKCHFYRTKNMNNVARCGDSHL